MNEKRGALTIRLALFGTLELIKEGDRGPAPLPLQPKRAAVLVYLAVAGSSGVTE